MGKKIEADLRPTSITMPKEMAKITRILAAIEDKTRSEWIRDVVQRAIDTEYAWIKDIDIKYNTKFINGPAIATNAEGNGSKGV